MLFEFPLSEMAEEEVIEIISNGLDDLELAGLPVSWDERTLRQIVRNVEDGVFDVGEDDNGDVACAYMAALRILEVRKVLGRDMARKGYVAYRRRRRECMAA